MLFTPLCEVVSTWRSVAFGELRDKQQLYVQKCSVRLPRWRRLRLREKGSETDQSRHLRKSTSVVVRFEPFSPHLNGLSADKESLCFVRETQNKKLSQAPVFPGEAGARAHRTQGGPPHLLVFSSCLWLCFSKTSLKCSGWWSEEERTGEYSKKGA